MSDVIELFGGDQDDHKVPVRTRERDPEAGRPCVHRRVELDPDARRVYCRDCGHEVPAFDYLAYLAAHTEQYMRARDGARASARRAAEHLADLERRERNAKERVRRAEARRDRVAARRAVGEEMVEIVARAMSVNAAPWSSMKDSVRRHWMTNARKAIARAMSDTDERKER